MKIILINHRFDHFSPQFPSSPGIVLHEYCRAAIRAGDEPIVISSPGRNPPHEGIRVEFVNPPPYPTTRIGNIAGRARRRLRGERYMRHAKYIHDVVNTIKAIGYRDNPIITNGDPDLAIALKKILPCSNVINVFHHHEKYKEILYERFRQSHVKLVGVSNFLARKIETDATLPTGTIATVYNGVDASHFIPAPEPIPGPIVLNCMGHTAYEKGPDLLLTASKILWNRGYHNFILQIIGKENNDEFKLTDYEQRLHRQAEELRMLGIQIRMPGWISRVILPSVMQRAHINVVPIRCDTAFGMATIEGMACGLATVASRTGGTPEVVADAGLIYEKNAVDQLVNLLEQLLHNSSLRIEVANRGITRSKIFSWDSTWRQMKSVICTD